MGSVKTNIGHLESASGAAGLIKVVLSLQHAMLPSSLHFDNPSPHIPWDSLPVRVVDSPRPWEANGRPRRAGVSSFGFTGTNAHVLIEEAPPAPPAPDVEEAPAVTGAAAGTVEVLPLSARSPKHCWHWRTGMRPGWTDTPTSTSPRSAGPPGWGARISTTGPPWWWTRYAARTRH